MANWRICAAAAAFLLSACALGPPNSTRPEDAAPAPPPPAAQTEAPVETAREVAAPGVAIPPPPPAPQRNAGDVVVPGRTQLPPPSGDTRTTAQRREDIARWDRCVMRAQSASEGDAMSPQLETPEDLCRQTLGQADRLSPPRWR
jgi:hypothetical protein